MLAPAIPANEAQRLEAIEGAMCAHVPHEERFDRITRIARRLLDVPISLISIVDKDVQWFRSAQGLTVGSTGRDVSFCGHAILEDRTLMVPDVSKDPRFFDNPLVTGGPRIRSYLGVPLTLSPDMRVGTLCFLDTMPHSFNYDDLLAAQDLARIAEGELKIDAMSGVQRRLLTRLGKLERDSRLDPATGCWNVRGFRELVALAAEDALCEGSDLALCYVRVRNFDMLARSAEKEQVDTVRQLLAQILRRRLPESGALAMLGTSDFCAMVPGATQLAVENSLAEFTHPLLKFDVPGIHFDMALELQFGLVFLDEVDAASAATDLWATALARLGN